MNKIYQIHNTSQKKCEDFDNLLEAERVFLKQINANRNDCIKLYEIVEEDGEIEANLIRAFNF